MDSKIFYILGIICIGAILFIGATRPMFDLNVCDKDGFLIKHEQINFIQACKIKLQYPNNTYFNKSDMKCKIK